MPFEYAAVARHDIILAQQACSSGNFDVLILGILKQLNPSDQRFQCEKSTHKIFIEQLDTGINFSVIGTQDITANDAFDFLRKLQTTFLMKHGRNWSTASSFSFQSEFSPVIKSLLTETDKIKEIHENLNEAQELMKENIKEVYLRGSTIEALDNGAENIVTSSKQFNRKSTSMRRQMCWEKYKLGIIAGIFILALIIIIVIVVTAKSTKSE
ncbi:Synaptobrevin family protein [Histomonas meleagridis]|uniref:Synaptobrevin family protein n=1 Tax=Histomonas meleagridis TaxID=135588 RepID=UPI00355A8AB0|nr:Synaptobrevin family protein [Histomonas meleagridis]KAH0804907.1 Synaptobrevin family protein [Histomonas meleagridis]